MDQITDLKFGLHSSTTDFTSTPGTVSTLNALSHGLRPRERSLIERPGFSADNRMLAPMNGVMDIGAFAVEMMFRGVSGNAGGAFTPQSSMEQARMLDSIFGTAAAAITGSAATVAGGSTPGLTASSTVVNDGDMILFQTSTGWFAREVVSGGGTVNLVLDRAYTGTPTNGSTIYRAARWNGAPATIMHTHGYFRAENLVDNWRRDAFGCCAESMSLACAEGDVVRMSSSWRPNDVQDVAETDPSYSGPTAGDGIPCAGSWLWLGDTAFLARGLRVEITNELAPRVTTQGTNGVLGYAVRNKRYTVSGQLYIGANTGSIGELQDSAGTPSAVDLMASSASAGSVRATYDLAVQLGARGTAALYARMPAASFSARGEAGPEGQSVLAFTATAVAPSAGAPFRLGVF